jgi:nitrous oxide reductase accessory protein NosL
MRKVYIILAVLLLLGVFALAWASEPVTPGPKDKCPVCGMIVSKYPKWVAEILFKDGTYVAFDGPKDMFRYYFNLGKYGKSADQIDAIYVTEYYTTKMVKADDKDLYFVIGSDVYGPMGMELIPVKGKEKAEIFMKDHKGKKMLQFSEITPNVLPKMKMKKMKMEHMQMEHM